MKALKIIGIVIVILALAVFITIQLLPDEVHMSRSVTIQSSPANVYREIVTFKNFNDWSPWAAKDTATVYTYEGPAVGVGSKLSWKSDNSEVGTGSMEIIETDENKLVKTVMKFEGFDSSPTASFLMGETEEGGTELSWTYDETDVSGIGRIFGLMMDKFLGPDYEAGLSAFKARMESAPVSSTLISLEDAPRLDYLGIETTTDMEMISSVMAQNYGELMTFMGKNQIEMNGYPIAVINSWSPEEMTFICGIPVEGDTPALTGKITRQALEGGTVIKSVYKGDYSGSEIAHQEIEAYTQFANYEIIGAPWEEYVTDPTVITDTAEWITNIYYPVN